MNNGYIKLFRSFRDWYGYGNTKRVALWIELLLLATHQDAAFLFNGEPTELRPGQFITGRNKLSQATGISEAYIEDLLNEFEKQGQIQQQKKTTSRMITIVNWSDFQNSDNRTTTERQPSDNGATTERHIQEGKEHKKVRREEGKEGRFIPPTIEEVVDYCQERNSPVDPHTFYDKGIGTGWVDKNGNKYKDWKAVVRTWEKMIGKKETTKQITMGGINGWLKNDNSGKSI